MFRLAFAGQQLERPPINERPVAGACQKPHEHGPMRRPQSRDDSRESHRTPMLGSRFFRLECPVAVTWTS
jgi:hypothetical protein